jgi:hypothetical protein
MIAKPEPNDEARAPDSGRPQEPKDADPKRATLVPDDLPEDERIESENDLA